MNSKSSVSETSHQQQHPNVKEEIDANSVELVIKVEDEREEVKVECEDIEVDLKVEDEEKPTMCQCEECGSGCCRKMAMCTRAIKKEEWEGDDGQQSGKKTRRGKRTEILVKEEVKEEEDEANVAGPLTQRCGSASAIIKFEDEDVTCPCEECGMIKREEEGEEVKEEKDVAAKGGGSSDDETVIEDEEDWLPSTGSSLGSSSEEEEETEAVPNELVQEPIETVSGTASLDVRPLAGADAVQVRTAKGCKRRPCPQCQKMVTHLTNHLRTHTEERPHICDQCRRSFKVKSHLNTHLKIHTGEKAFSCDQCGKSFAQKENLTDHLKRHNGEKAHQCDQCPSAFVSSAELTNHRRHKHTGERPYRCHIANCDKAFANKSNLSQHLKHHTGDKRHQCEDCEMRFVTSTQLTKHRRHKHSTERPHRCPHSGCNYAAATKDGLRQHLKKGHRQIRPL